MAVQEYGRFMCECLLHPAQVGAIAPSTRRLAREMVRWVDWQEVGSVVEYGPGTGVLTEQVLRNLRGDGRFFAVELNGQFVASLQKRFPAVTVYEDSVANVEALCRQEGLSQVDAVMSGLPWAAFSDRAQNEYLDATMSILRPGGYFASFAYLQGMVLPAAQRFRRKLQDYFSEVHIGRTVWLNVPPAFVYQCRR